MTVFEEDAEQLTEQVRQVLANSRESRDEQGAISTPGRRLASSYRRSNRSNDKVHGIFEYMIYVQVTAGFVWAKEIDGVMVEVRMKRMREKEGLAREWTDALEVDIRLEDKGLEAGRIVEQLGMVRDLWLRVGPKA